MTIASSHILSWPPQGTEDGPESDSTLAISPEECPYIVVSADATASVGAIAEQKDEDASFGEELLGALGWPSE